MEMCLAVGGVVVAFLGLLVFMYWYNKPEQRSGTAAGPLSEDSGLVSRSSNSENPSISVVHEQGRSLTEWVNIENAVSASHYSSISDE
jgi:hypothetical protein